MLRIEMNAVVSGLRIMPSTAESSNIECSRVYPTFSVCWVVALGKSWSMCAAKTFSTERDYVQQVLSLGHFADDLRLC